MSNFSDRLRVRKSFDLLTGDQRREIHEAALEVMERTGVRIHSDRARKDLKAAGATVHEGSAVVRFPRAVVDDLVKRAPSTIVLAGRTKEFDLPMDGSHFYTTTDGCGISVWDATTGTRRKSVLEDIRRTAVIANWLPFASIYEPMVVAHDVPETVHVIMGLKTAIENTEKHLLTESTTNPVEADAQVRMAAEVVGSEEELRKRHYLSAMLCTLAPLSIDGAAADAALVWAENHVPVHVTGMAQAGVSGPATIAGDLVVNHAETLAAVCMLEAHEPGAPAIYGSVLSSMDPRTGSYMGASPESGLLAIGSIEMAKHCHLPDSVGGFGSGAKIPGVQASLENALSAIVCANYGGEVVNGLGVVDGSTLLSYEQLLLDHEIAGMILKMYQGFDVNRETLAVDLIEKVGIGGTYLAQMHTLKQMKDLYTPLLWDTSPFDLWVERGRKDPMAAAREKTEWILGHHEPAPLDPGTVANLDRIVREFGKG
ncbi:MAG TPA: trimethylamine methyltransferase family protein [Thermoplasmata archaeon]|nr:trimethylamine methyltransferase family protein [Thermoplasmata archaeon]